MQEKSGEYISIPQYLRDFEREGFIALEYDTIRFCDPVYGDTVADGDVPRSLLEDEVMCEGIPALQRLAQKGVEINLALNYHRGDQDVEPLQKEAPWLKDCRLVGLEWGGAFGEMPQHAGEIQFDAMTSTGNGRYVELVNEWLERNDVTTVPSDINTHLTVSDTDMIPRPEQDILRTRLAQVWTHGQHDTMTAEEWERHHLAWCVYQYSRQYLLIAHFGYMAAQYEDDLQPGDAIALQIGSGHKIGVSQKMQQFEIPLARCEVVRESDDTPVANFMFNQAMPYGKLNRQDLREMAEYSMRGSK